jgi:hypothetical protein
MIQLHVYAQLLHLDSLRPKFSATRETGTRWFQVSLLLALLISGIDGLRISVWTETTPYSQ